MYSSRFFPDLSNGPRKMSESYSPTVTLKNTAAIAAQDVSIVWEIPAYDIGSLVQSSVRLQPYGATQNGNMTTLGGVMNPQGSPQGLSFTFARCDTDAPTRGPGTVLASTPDVRG